MTIYRLIQFILLYNLTIEHEMICIFFDIQWKHSKMSMSFLQRTPKHLEWRIKRRQMNFVNFVQLPTISRDIKRVQNERRYLYKKWCHVNIATGTQCFTNLLTCKIFTFWMLRPLFAFFSFEDWTLMSDLESLQKNVFFFVVTSFHFFFIFSPGLRYELHLPLGEIWFLASLHWSRMFYLKFQSSRRSN